MSTGSLLVLLSVICFVIAALPHRMNVRWEWRLGAAFFVARLLIVVTLFLALGVAGCAKARHVAVLGDVAFSQAVFALDDAELAACQNHTLRPQQCDELNPKIRQALIDVKAVTAAIQASPKSGVVPTSLPDLLKDLTDAQAVIAPLAAAGGPLADLGQKSTNAINQAIALLRAIAGGGD